MSRSNSSCSGKSSNQSLLASVDLRDLQRALRRKVRAYEDRSSHHVHYVAILDGAECTVARFSHSFRGGQLSDNVVSDTAKRLRLSKSELEDLVECPLSAEAFLELWHDRSP